MILVDVWVPGAAKTKGSMVVRNRTTGTMKESVAGSSAWRALMAQAVRDDIARRRGSHVVNLPYHSAVRVTCEFLLGATGKAVEPGFLAYNPWPIWERAGDVDKLARNVLDALGSRSKNARMNGGAIADDNLVCDLVVRKRVAGPAPGVRIVVETL